MSDVPKRTQVRALPRQAGGVASGPRPDDLYRPGKYSQALLRSLIRAQLAMSISVLLPAAAVIGIYPLLADLFPGVALDSLGPVPLSVIILGFGIYPPLVLLALYYVRRARQVEETFVNLLREE